MSRLGLDFWRSCPFFGIRGEEGSETSCLVVSLHTGGI